MRRDRTYPGVSKYKDRHGKWRWRGKGKPTIHLPGTYGSPEFTAAWHDWINGKPIALGTDRCVPGSISALVAGYYLSNAFAEGLAENTRRAYRAALERFRTKNGHKSVASLTRDHIGSLLEKLPPEPSNMMLRCIRALCRHAVEKGMIKIDPTIGMRKRKNPNARRGGIHTWTIAEIEQFEARHPIGTKAHLALSLLLYTAARRSDVVQFGRQHEIEGGTAISFRQMKTDDLLVLPIVAPLRAAIDAARSKGLSYLETEYGKPFRPAGFGNWFRDRCNEAGLPHCSAHGLRKATAKRLADAGATTHQIKAITGHRSLSEVERYTRAADQVRLARSVATVVAGAKDELGIGELSTRFASIDAKLLTTKE